MKAALLILLLLVGGVGYFFYQQNQALVQDNANLSLSLESQEEKFEAQRNEFEAQTEAMDELRETNVELQKQKDHYLSKFNNFEDRLFNDPEIEDKMNNATRKALNRIEVVTGGLVDEEN